MPATKQHSDKKKALKGKGRINQESGINVYILLYIKWITKKDLLHSPANSTQYFVTTDKGKESLKNRYTCMYN